MIDFAVGAISQVTNDWSHFVSSLYFFSKSAGYMMINNHMKRIVDRNQ